MGSDIWSTCNVSHAIMRHVSRTTTCVQTCHVLTVGTLTDNRTDRVTQVEASSPNTDSTIRNRVIRRSVTRHATTRRMIAHATTQVHGDHGTVQIREKPTSPRQQSDPSVSRAVPTIVTTSTTVTTSITMGTGTHATRALITR